MTNKEAIRTLEANYPDACFEQLREAVDAAIEALKAQEVSNNSPELDSDSDDTISRQTILDALDEIESEVADGEGFLYEKWREYFCDLPSAQPDSKELSGTHKALDTVSRQAAIDAMCELMHHWFGGDSKDEIREIKRELENLPSAQPETNCSEIPNNSDLISRKTAIDGLKEAFNPSITNFVKAKLAIENLPSASQRTGRWVQIKESIKVAQYRCSECGRTVCNDSGYDPYIDYPYCHCGARMEGEE